MIIECSSCESKVDCEIKGEADFDVTHETAPVKVFLLQCKLCDNPLLGLSELLQVDLDEWQWSYASRLWPDPENEIDFGIPDIARFSLNEAKICYRAKAYSACAVMCGRAIEGLCMHYDESTRSLADGLAKLKQAGVIDGRLFQWAETLRENRNLGAHATTEQVSRQDAQDLLDFSVAICEYVFVFQARWERFQARRNDV